MGLKVAIALAVAVVFVSLPSETQGKKANFSINEDRRS
jgi:hypothetical protein